MKTIFDFEPNHYYIRPGWEGSGMCLTVGSDFKFKFGFFRDGTFNVFDGDVKLGITEKFIEI